MAANKASAKQTTSRTTGTVPTPKAASEANTKNMKKRQRATKRLGPHRRKKHREAQE
jgi:hypothetical protein